MGPLDWLVSLCLENVAGDQANAAEVYQTRNLDVFFFLYYPVSARATPCAEPG